MIHYETVSLLFVFRLLSDMYKIFYVKKMQMKDCLLKESFIEIIYFHTYEESLFFLHLLKTLADLFFFLNFFFRHLFEIFLLNSRSLV